MSPLHLTPHISRRWLALLALIHFGAGGCVLLSQAPFWVMAAAGLAIALNLVYEVRRALLLGANTVTKMWVTTEGQWYLHDRSEKVMAVKLLGSSFVSRFLLILNFKQTDQRRPTSIMIWPDSIDALSFRQLTAVLLSGGSSLE